MTTNNVSMLREARIQAGLTQKQLSEWYQVPLRSLQDWETFKRTPPEYVLNMLLRCLAVDFEIRLKNVPSYNGEKFTLMHLDGTPLSDTIKQYVKEEAVAGRVKTLNPVSPVDYRIKYLQCANGFIFKTIRN